MSRITRTLDLYGRYYVSADPSTSEVNSAWGIPVLVSTQFTAGKVVLLDTSIYGRAVIREPLITRIGSRSFAADPDPKRGRVPGGPRR